MAHNYVPNCDEDAIVYHDHHYESSLLSHEHHETGFDSYQKSSDHTHYIHNDHSDETLMDLFECLLLELEHPTDNCGFRYYIGQKSTSTNVLNGPIIPIILMGEAPDDEVYHCAILSYFRIPPLLQNYLTYSKQTLPHRGPPVS